MSKENIKILKMIEKIYEEKGYDTEGIKEMAEISKTTPKKKLHKIEKITDLKDMITQSAHKFGDKPAFKFKGENEGEFKHITFKEFYDDINALGTQLIKMGLKEKRIAIIAENRYEWCVAYLATVCGVGCVVPLDKALPSNELESLIIRSGVEAIFYSDKYNDVMQDISKRRTTDLRYYISMDLTHRTDGILSQKEFIQKGKELIKDGDKSFLDAKIDNESMQIMLFTSGTTAMSKAVMLSHKNICSNLMDIASVLKLDTNDTLLSLLPLHHTFECTAGFLYPMYVGSSIAYCDGIRYIQKNIRLKKSDEI